MATTLLENYKKRLAISEAVYKGSHEGAELPNSKKMATAMLLNNVNKFMNEAFSNSVGTQRADLGAWKKWCMNLTTVVVPSLIASDLVITYPMSSISGYITYIKYTSGTNKGATKRGDVFNDPFRLGKVDPEFTGESITEAVESSGEVTLAWTPVVKEAFGAGKDVKFIADGTGVVSYLQLDSTGTKVTVTGKGKIAYKYDNVVIPQNDLPVVNAEVASIPLIAKARRVAVYYSQIAAYQAKTDYGFDLGDQLAEKACGQLAYEIDTEITDLLISNAVVDEDLTFNTTLPVGVSKAQHYEGFAEIVEFARKKIYDKTKRFAPNYMLASSGLLRILSFVPGFKAANPSNINGPYLAGTLNGGMKVFVTPNIAEGKFVFGVNGDDMMSSAAVYAPYMAIVPTQLLGMADGAMSQGFSTMYALEMLNSDLLVAGQIVTLPQVVVTKEAE